MATERRGTTIGYSLQLSALEDGLLGLVSLFRLGRGEAQARERRADHVDRFRASPVEMNVGVRSPTPNFTQRPFSQRTQSMAQYMITSIFTHADGRRENAEDLLGRAQAVTEQRLTQAPGVTFGSGYALLDRYEIIDFVEAESLEEVENVADTIREYGQVQTIVTPVLSKKQFIDNLRAGVSHRGAA